MAGKSFETPKTIPPAPHAKGSSKKMMGAKNAQPKSVPPARQSHPMPGATPASKAESKWRKDTVG